MPIPQRLPFLDGDEAQWGSILNQFLNKEHYNDGTDNAVNGGHQTITIRAGTTAAGTAPLKFTSGSLLTTPETGAMEFLTDGLYFTVTTGAVRRTIAAYDDSSGATGDIYYRNSSGTFTRLPIGTNGYVLQVASGLPSWAAAAGGGDASTNTATSVDSEIALFSGTGGKTLKRATGSGLVTATSGVYGTVTAPSGTVVGTSDSQTLTNKTLTSPVISSISNTGTLTLPTSTDTLIGRATTDTLTNKRVTPRVGTAADATSITPDSDSYDVVKQTNTQAAGTLTINAPTGTPTNGQKLILRVKLTNGSFIVWNAIYRGSSDISLPAAHLGASKTNYYGFMYNADDSKWDLVALVSGF